MELIANIHWYILYFLVFIIGASVGSFLNVVIDRLPRDIPLFISRSKCEKCGKKLTWYDLFPVFSYLALSGRCRFCKSKIPARLFFVEVIAGIVSVYLFANFLTSVISPVYYILLFLVFSSFLTIFLTDIKNGIIPDEALIALLFFSLLMNLLFNGGSFILFLLSGIGSLLFFLLLFFITRGQGMGFGDVKFSFVIGFLLGFPQSVLAFYLAFLTGAFISIILILAGKKKFKKDTVPFAPFMIVGACVTFLFGSAILKYFGLF